MLLATRPYASETRGRSWWHLVSTFTVLLAAGAAAIVLPWWPLQLLAGTVAGLTMVRAFILVHDLHHGAIFRNAPLPRSILTLYGLAVITPKRVWRETHNYHHAHTGKTGGPQRGTYSLFTVDQWREAGRFKRFTYRVERHPLTLLLGYLTVFLISFGLARFVTNPRRYWDSGVALAVHAAIGATVYLLAGPAAFYFAFLVPFALSGVSGAYLFYAQHNFEGMQVPEPDEWSHTQSSLESSSYLKLGPVMSWFTGNIGYHHVHHLNPRIPFYRLPEAMRAIPELAPRTTISLTPRSIWASFRLKLWDPAQACMVGYGAASTSRS